MRLPFLSTVQTPDTDFLRRLPEVDWSMQASGVDFELRCYISITTTSFSKSVSVSRIYQSARSYCLVGIVDQRVLKASRIFSSC
jgi:hypothetical protein